MICAIDFKVIQMSNCKNVQLYKVLEFSSMSYGSKGANSDLLLLLRNIIQLKLTQDTFALVAKHPFLLV